MRILEFILGATITITTLWDVFTTVIVPGRPPGWLGIAGLVRVAALPAWRASTREGSGLRYHHNLFAPVLLLLAFLSWVFLLFIGFGLQFHACAELFEPALHPFTQALYVAGSSILTLGVSEVDAFGFARWLILAAGLAGLSIVTVTVTFILQIQSALQQRETAVLALSGVAGKPGSGIQLLETYAELKLTGDLPLLFRSWRDWSASVLHSHAAHPVLSYFRSADAESDWPAALAIMLDAAMLVAAFTDDPAAGSATLMHRSGSRTAERLLALYKLDAADIETPSNETVSQLRDRLGRAGYNLRQDDQLAARLEAIRADYAGRAAALADHLGTRRVDLLPA